VSTFIPPMLCERLTNPDRIAEPETAPTGRRQK
jgi:hypothetical protein